MKEDSQYLTSHYFSHFSPDTRKKSHERIYTLSCPHRYISTVYSKVWTHWQDRSEKRRHEEFSILEIRSLTLYGILSHSSFICEVRSITLDIHPLFFHHMSHDKKEALREYSRSRRVNIDRSWMSPLCEPLYKLDHSPILTLGTRYHSNYSHHLLYDFNTLSIYEIDD